MMPGYALWRRTWRVFLAMSVCHVPFTAAAASFDCAKARTPHEHAICQHPALSELDARLGMLYQSRLALLSKPGVEALQRSQQQWLRFIRTVCPLASPSGKPDVDAAVACLSGEYEQRLRQLDVVGRKLGPFVFTRVDMYKAAPATDDFGHHPGFYTQHVAYPQIDAPATPVAQAWNKRQETALQEGPDPCDEDQDYSLGYANDRLISVRLTESSYCHETPHGTWTALGSNTVLLPSMHELTAAELFGEKNDWQARLKALFAQALAQQDPDDRNDDNQENVLAVATSPRSWTFDGTGLTVAFSAYDGGCYVCTPAPLTVPWRKLKPLLDPKAPLP
jgi:uncharacterized protein